MRIILAAGGSGGHIFPATAVASELGKDRANMIFFVSSKRTLDKNILFGSRFPSFFLSINPMPLKFNPVKLIIFLLKLIADSVVSLFLIIKLRPDVVAGFGGYSSGAIVIAAKLSGVPVIIHEQNFTPGRANRMLSRIVDRIAVSFRGSEKHFLGAQQKAVYTGNPLRTEMLSNDRVRSLGRLGLSEGKKTVLVMGGSQGSHFINRTASLAAKLIKEKSHGKIQFIHLTGKYEEEYDYVISFYRRNDIDGKVFPFLDRIDDAYASSDIAISRAGAAALFELAFYSKAMILVPYPNPLNNQRSNAVYFSEAGAAVCKEEKELTADGLAEEVINILTDKDRLDRMSCAAGDLRADEASKVLGREIITLGLKKNNI